MLKIENSVTILFPNRLFSNQTSIHQLIIHQSLNNQIMRKLSLVFVAAMLLVTGNILANDAVEVDPTKKLSTQIGELLEDNFLTFDDVSLTAQVRFTLNNEGEIVVLSVKTKNERFESFVKSRLNYHKIDMVGATEGKMYTVPIRITS
jgi:hypothetical protein